MADTRLTVIFDGQTMPARSVVWDVPPANVQQYICPWCKAIVDMNDCQIITWSTSPGFTTSTSVCIQCANREPCKTTSGMHGEMFDLNEDIRWVSKLELPAELTGLPNGQVGICSICYKWQIWSVEQQRWTDPFYFNPEQPYWNCWEDAWLLTIMQGVRVDSSAHIANLVFRESHLVSKLTLTGNQMTWDLP